MIQYNFKRLERLSDLSNRVIEIETLTWSFNFDKMKPFGQLIFRIHCGNCNHPTESIFDVENNYCGSMGMRLLYGGVTFGYYSGIDDPDEYNNFFCEPHLNVSEQTILDLLSCGACGNNMLTLTERNYCDVYQFKNFRLCAI